MRMRWFVWCLIPLLHAGAAQAGPPVKGTDELARPSLRIHLEGETGKRLDKIIDNWLLTTPDANPGIIEMMRLRDKKPPYEDPMPWAGEFIGKYLTSCVLIHRMTENPQLDALLKTLIPELISTQGPDGYLGPFPDKPLLDRWDLWGHYHCMLALYLWYQDTGDRTALEAALRAADLVCATFLDTGKRVHDAGSHEMNMSVIHVLGLLYRETGKEAYFRMMKEIEKDWEKPPAGDYYRQALTGIEYYCTPKPRWESLHPMLGLGELYRITGDDSYKRALLHWWRSINATDVHNSGSFSTNEQAVGNPFQSGSIETCCTVAWLALSVDALRLSSDSTVVDSIERATWNAVLGYEHPSGRWCTYDTPMNGKRRASAEHIVFQARTGTPELNCCSVNGPRGLGLISEWAVLGDAKGLYLNYYGPGRIEARLADGSVWVFAQKTAYPVAGAIHIEVTPGSSAVTPLYLRIPGWSAESTVSVNGEMMSGIQAGTYLRVERVWKAGDVIDLTLDMRVRALRGDHHVQFNTSLFKGPLLLTFDQKHNSIDPGDLPELDLKGLELTAATCDARFQPMVLFKAKAVDGRDVYLTDFATAGAHGTYYRSWLPVRNAPPAPIQLVCPESGARLPVEDVFFSWSEGEPGATYDFAIAEDAAFKKVVFHRDGLSGTQLEAGHELQAGKTYYWRVEAKRDGQGVAAMNGPLPFVLDPAAETSVRGTVVRAALAGTAAPGEGTLLSEAGVKPSANRAGEANGALAFDGESSKVVYDAPRFPLRTFTFSAWFCPKDLTEDGKRWHHLCSGWCTSMNDPLRVSVQDKELVVNVEQASGGAHLSGGPVENGVWTHVAVVKRVGEIALYVNGKRVQGTTIAPCLQSGAKNFGIGCNPNYGELEGFKGSIAEVQFVREALDDAGIARLFDGRK